jgi:hypothetical protein
MLNEDQRPPVWIGHVGMHSPNVDATADFMETIGMRRIFRRKDFAVLEMRGGTHLVVTDDPDSELIQGGFDLMVEDLDGTHREFVELGLNPSEIRRGEIHDEFDVREPGGTVILFNSTHVGEFPV